MLKPDEQDKFLQAAVEKKLSVHELRAAVRLLQKPQPKIDWQEPADSPEIPMPETEEYPEVEEQILPCERPDIEREFKHLLNLVKALLVAERGNLARGSKPNEQEAIRLRTALDLFIAEHEQKMGGQK